MESLEARLSDNQKKVIAKRYLKKGDTPEQWLRRVAHNIALSELLYDERISKKDIFGGVKYTKKGNVFLLQGRYDNVNDRYDNFMRYVRNLDVLYETNPVAREVVSKYEEKFYTLLSHFYFLPNSPTLMNAGGVLQQLSGCFVLPVEDSIDGWGTAIKDTMNIHKSGGGTGFSFSKVRPKNDDVKSTRGVASGPLSPMSIIDSATDEVKQGGTRRGANMGILRVDHPDIRDFITAKSEKGKLQNFNISVAATEEFMNALKNGGTYKLINPKDGSVVREESAKEIFDLIVQTAYRTADPGIVFLDIINKFNPTPQLGAIESTNPCGEQPLLPYESCNLGSISIEKFVENGKLNYSSLEECVQTAVRFLDDVIDVNNLPLPEIERMTKGNRKIGLGIMGWAEALVKMGLCYDSEEAFAKGEEVIKFISDSALNMSVQLGKERGVFPNYKGSIYDKKGKKRIKPRNAGRITIAPTGTIAIAAGVRGSGIEPFFSLIYERHSADAIDALKEGKTPNKNDTFHEYNPLFKDVAEKNNWFGFKSETDLQKIILKNHGSIRGISEVPEDIQRLFVTAHDINYEGHTRMQAAFQSATDNAVSKTINFPASAKPEDVAKAYLLAYELGCKGVTIYVDQSKEFQPLSSISEKKGRKYIKAKRRPETVPGFTKKLPTGCGNLFVTTNSDEEGPFEIFGTLGKSGGCSAAGIEAVGRLNSLCLRSGINPSEIATQLIGISCPKQVFYRDGIRIESCYDAMGRVLAEIVDVSVEKLPRDAVDFSISPESEGDNKNSEGVNEKKEFAPGSCSGCGAKLVFESGCRGGRCTNPLCMNDSCG